MNIGKQVPIQFSQRLDGISEYYFSRKLKEIDALRASGKVVINLGTGNPDLQPPQQAASGLCAAVAGPKNHMYQSYRSTEELRKAFAWWYNEHFNVVLDSQKEILPLLGSKEGILYTSLAFLNPGDKVLIPNPGYPTYTSVTKMVGAIPVYYELKPSLGWRPDMEEIESHELEGVKIMWINYPSMPTGTAASKKLFGDLVAFARKNRILLCHDNPYGLLANNRPLSVLSMNGAHEVAVELNSLSKSHNMPGWRVGVVAGIEQYINAILTMKSNVDSGMFFPVQQGAVAALYSPANWYRQQREIYNDRRNIVVDLFRKLGCTVDDGQEGMFVWARIPQNYADGKTFADTMLSDHGLFIVPGEVFGSSGKQYVRAALCADEKTLLSLACRMVETERNEE